MEETDEGNDAFIRHFQRGLPDEVAESLCKGIEYETVKTQWPVLGNLTIKTPKLHSCTTKPEGVTNNFKLLEKTDCIDWNKFYIKQQIHDHINGTCERHVGHLVTPFQLELLQIVSEYKDLFFSEETFLNQEEIRLVYCLHAINHALKTRLKVIHHNARLVDKDDVPDEFRDQGLVRPKVLILVPFRNSALKVVKMICSILLPGEKDNIVNKKRFLEEFTGEGISDAQKNTRPEDYVNTFCGNIDDNFKVGISITKKSLKLYADFYSSDIIVASPLGLRMIIGAEGEADRDYDFLASIELLILDQTEMFLMQNWDHVLHIMDHLHLLPKESHDTNFARVRFWSINGWSQLYRQTLVFCSQPLPEIIALVSKRCRNYEGVIRVNNPVTSGTLCQVFVKVPQVFYQIPAASAVDSIEKRFDFFTQKILPQYQENLYGHIMVYIPSYFDFVRLRNYFVEETISFVQVCEYTKGGKVAEARDKFFHREANFMLFSERFHFYHRRRIRGIRHLIFYQLPTFPHLYSEICNFMQESRRNKKQRRDDHSMTISVIYSKYDVAQLSAIVTSDRAKRMLSSGKDVHMFSTDDGFS